MEDSKKQDTYLEKIDKQIEIIENKINALLEDINIEEITPIDKMELAIKFMAQYTKFLALRKSSELSMPEGQEKALLAVWMRQLRGESVDG
jgi:hypothetical protein